MVGDEGEVDRASGVLWGDGLWRWTCRVPSTPPPFHPSTGGTVHDAVRHDTDSDALVGPWSGTAGEGEAHLIRVGL
jgi:hypothetical protein